jgi:hypothetical protein
VAVDGSKFDGTGLENVQMGHIHVPDVLGGASAGGRKGLSVRGDGVVPALREGLIRVLNPLLGIEDLFEGLRKSVILAEDLRKPACRFC